MFPDAEVPVVPLCLEACGRLADAGDRSPRCVPCGLRLAHLAMRPDRFSDAEIAAVATDHADLVAIGSEPIERHTAPTRLAVARGLADRRPDWPTDDRTLDHILEARGLERLWDLERSA